MCRRVWRTVSSASSTGSLAGCMLQDLRCRACLADDHSACRSRTGRCRRSPRFDGSAQPRARDDQERDRPDQAQCERDRATGRTGEHLGRMADAAARAGRCLGSDRARARGAAQLAAGRRGHVVTGSAFGGLDRVAQQHRDRVVGPTPPRRGVIQPATSAHASSTSGTTLRPLHRLPRTDDRGAGLHHVGLDDARATRRPRRGCRPPSCTRGEELRRRCARRVTVAFACRLLQREQVRERPADREPAPDDRRRAGPRSGPRSARAAPGCPSGVHGRGAGDAHARAARG